MGYFAFQFVLEDLDLFCFLFQCNFACLYQMAGNNIDSSELLFDIFVAFACKFSNERFKYLFILYNTLYKFLNFIFPLG